GSLVVADMGLVIFSRDTVKAGGRNALRRIVEVPSERIMVLSCENESGQITRLLEHSYGTDDRVTSILRLVTRRSLESPEQTKLNRWLERPYTTAFPGRLIKRLNIAEEDELTRFRRQV